MKLRGAPARSEIEDDSLAGYNGASTHALPICGPANLAELILIVEEALAFADVHGFSLVGIDLCNALEKLIVIHESEGGRGAKVSD